MTAGARGESPLGTFLQAAPRLLRVLPQLRPTWHLPALGALDAGFVAAHGIGGLIWDVDGTLTGDGRPTLEPEAERPFRSLLALPGVRHVILSNAREARYRELSSLFPEIPILRAYRHRGGVLYRTRHGAADSWTDAEAADRLAGGARVIKKPNALLVDYAVRELGCAPAAVVMVGDQYLTDVAGANLAGIRSVKLPTLARASFPAAVRFSQRVERLLYALLYRG